MTDIDPTIPADATPDEIDALAPEIQDAARKNFSLASRLQGIKLKGEKVLIFTDMDAVLAYTAIDNEHSELGGTIVALSASTKPEDVKQVKTLQRQFDKMEADVEAAKIDMLETALSIHMLPYPGIAQKVARREARKIFMKNGIMTAEQQGDSQEWMERRLLGESITQIVESSGELLPIEDRKTLGFELEDQLPPSQWQRVLQTYQRMMYVDTIGTLATNDAGF